MQTTAGRRNSLAGATGSKQGMDEAQNKSARASTHPEAKQAASKIFQFGSLSRSRQVGQEAASAQRQHEGGQKHERELRHKVPRKPSKECYGQQRLRPVVGSGTGGG